MTLPAGATGSAVFEKVTAEPGKLFVQVDDKEDDFPLDNTGYALLEPARPSVRAARDCQVGPLRP